MDAMNGEPVLALRDVVVEFDGRRVLDGLDLAVAPGTIHALLGGNGAGKSTTLSTILGFITPTSGTVMVNGCQAGDGQAMVRRQLAYLPENVALYEHLSALENADYLLALAGERCPKAVIEAAFSDVGLQSSAWHARLKGFSKGMRQKVAIAVALARHVPLLLLDEPTSGLDPGASAEFHALLASVRDRGGAVLMVTHDIVGALDVADQVDVLAAGRIQLSQTRGAMDIAQIQRCFSQCGHAA